MQDIPGRLQSLLALGSQIDLAAAADGRKADIFCDSTLYPELAQRRKAIADVVGVCLS